jgi:hypothetical protein
MLRVGLEYSEFTRPSWTFELFFLKKKKKKKINNKIEKFFLLI